MAHFAKLSQNNEVLQVEVVDNSVLQDDNGNEIEQNGIDFLVSVHGWPYWKQTSYNTREGIYYTIDGEIGPDQSKSFRKNYAVIGGTYIPEKDAFMPKKLFNSWILNETTWTWDPPVTRPTIENYTVEGEERPYLMYWDEPSLNWKAEDVETPQNFFNWDVNTLSWVQT